MLCPFRRRGPPGAEHDWVMNSCRRSSKAGSSLGSDVGERDALRPGLQAAPPSGASDSRPPEGRSQLPGRAPV